MKPIDFNEVIDISKPFDCTITTKRKKVYEGYFVDRRIDRRTVPKGWYCYDIRSGGENWFATIEDKVVVVDYFGTFVTNKRITYFPHGYWAEFVGENDTDTRRMWDYSLC